MYHLFVLDQYDRRPSDYFKGSFATLEAAYKATNGEHAELYQTNEAGIMTYVAEITDQNNFNENQTRQTHRKGWLFLTGEFKLMESEYVEVWKPAPLLGFAYTGSYMPGMWVREYDAPFEQGLDDH